jgi:hypothetical protein
MLLVPISCKSSSRPWNSAFSDNVCHLFVTDRGFPPNIRVSFTNKIEYHDVIEILLKMAFNYTINLSTQHPRCKHVSTQHYMQGWIQGGGGGGGGGGGHTRRAPP